MYSRVTHRLPGHLPPNIFKEGFLMSRQSESHSDTNECYLMLSKVSHEIRNPVALINSFLQLLVNNHPELKEDSCYLKIEENMDYLKALLDELSTYITTLTQQIRKS